MKADERRFLEALFSLHEGKPYNYRFHTADGIGDDCGLAPKRSFYLLMKWSRRHWWDYGVSARTGWFTPEGIAAISGILSPPKEN